jgi:hypothetical protein
MSPLDEELKKALIRREPPRDFTAKVLREARCQESPAWRSFEWWRVAQGWRVAAALVTLLTLGGGAIYEQHQHELRGQAAKRELLIAMQIAGSRLNAAQKHVLHTESAEVAR